MKGLKTDPRLGKIVKNWCLGVSILSRLNSKTMYFMGFLYDGLSIVKL